MQVAGDEFAEKVHENVMELGLAFRVRPDVFEDVDDVARLHGDPGFFEDFAFNA